MRWPTRFRFVAGQIVEGCRSPNPFDGERRLRHVDLRNFLRNPHFVAE